MFTRQELLDMGFSSVGDNVRVSRDARFYDACGRLGDGVRIDDYAVLTGKIFLSDYVHISPFCFLGGTGGSIVMEEYSGMSSHVSIFTKSDDYGVREGSAIEKVCGDVHVGKKTILGSGVKVMPGSYISDYVSVGCNCVINQAIDEGSVIVSRATGLITLSKQEA